MQLRNTGFQPVRPAGFQPAEAARLIHRKLTVCAGLEAREPHRLEACVAANGHHPRDVAQADRAVRHHQGADDYVSIAMQRAERMHLRNTGFQPVRPAGFQPAEAAQRIQRKLTLCAGLEAREPHRLEACVTANVLAHIERLRIRSPAAHGSHTP
jgi:hypothetical protein